MPSGNDLYVVANWDPDANVWFVAETNVPGLVAEAPTVDAMLTKLKVLVPELLELNSEGEISIPPAFSLVTKVSGANGYC